jgi:Big-like domain-containing protein
MFIVNLAIKCNKFNKILRRSCKMKRTLSLMLALVMVLGTFTMAFANDNIGDAEMEAGAFLKANEVLKGDAEGDLLLGNVLKKQNAVVLLSRLMKVEELAKAFPTDEDTMYPDVTDPFYEGYIAWATTEGLIEGKGTGDFGFDASVTAREFATMVLRSLGYTVGEDADVEWDNALEFAIELGVAAEGTEDGIVSRGTVALMTFNALPLNIKDSEETLGEKLEIEMPTPAALEVEEVVANNLKEVKVVFNQEVNADTVTDANVKVKGEKGSVALNEDGVTAVITMEDVLDNQEEYTLQVDKVEAKNEIMLEDYEEDFTAFDATLPEALEVKVTGPRHLTVTFSEPINPEVKGKITLKKDKVNLGNAVEISGNKVNVRAYNDFKEGEEYTVKVEGFEDYAEYKNVVTTLDFTYEKDENPPVATVEKAEQTYVIVSFDKPVKGLKADKFYHTFTAWEAVEIENMDSDTKAINSNTLVNKVKVIFYDSSKAEGKEGNAIPAGETIFGILGKEIKDNWGNALGTQEFKVSTTSDRTKPEVKEVKVKSETSLEVTFTKDVDFERKNVEVLDTDGDKISGVYETVESVKDSKSKYTVKFGENLAGDTITLTIKNVKDTTLYENTLDLYTETLTVTDKTAPTIEEVYLSKKDTDGGRAMYVVFDEAVDSETALKGSNYTLYNSTRSKMISLKDMDLEFDVVNSRIKVSLSKSDIEDIEEKITTLGVGTEILVVNVEDVAGNEILPNFVAFKGLESKTEKVGFSVTFTSRDKLEIEFDDILSEVEAKNVTVNVYDGSGSNTVKQNFESFVQNDGTKTVLEIVLDNEMKKTDTNEINVAVATGDTENSYGAKVTEFTPEKDDNGDQIIVDEIKPEIALDNDEEEKISVTGNTYGEITIEFTEAMDPNTFSSLSFSVDDKKVVSAVATNDAVNEVYKVVLTLDKPFEENKWIRVTYDQIVKDLEGNNLDQEIGDVLVSKQFKK